MFRKVKTLLFNNISVGQTIFKNTLWLMSAEVISKGLGFFLTIWIARYLGASGYGKFSFAFAFVALFAILADFGLSTLTVREVARDKAKVKKYIDNIAVMKLILGVITFGLIALTIQFLGKTPEVKTLVYLAGIFIIIQSFTQFFQSVFRAFEKMEYQALSKIIYSCSLFGIAGFILWKHLGIKILVSSYIVAAGIALIITLALVWRKITKFWMDLDFKFWKSLLSEAWPFALSLVFISIYYYMDSVMLSVMKQDQAVGWYNAAYKPTMLIISIAMIFSNIILPIISRLYKESLEKLKKFLNLFTRFMAAIAIPIAFGGTLLASQIMKLLYGEEYLEGTLAFQILIWTAAIIYISVVYCNTLQGCNRQRAYLWGAGLGALVNIIFNFVLIPRYSLYGAACATFLAEFTVFSFIYFQVNKLVSIKVLPRLPKPFIAALVMSSVLYFIKSLNLFIIIFIGIIVYVFIMYVIKGFTKEEFLRLKNSLLIR